MKLFPSPVFVEGLAFAESFLTLVTAFVSGVTKVSENALIGFPAFGGTLAFAECRIHGGSWERYPRVTVVIDVASAANKMSDCIQYYTYDY